MQDQEDDMRQIGRTEDGETIVALSEMEVKLFEKLSSAVTGGTGENNLLLYDERIARSAAMNNYYDGVFGAILAWVQAKYAINKMQELLDGIRDVVG